MGKHGEEAAVIEKRGEMKENAGEQIREESVENIEDAEDAHGNSGESPENEIRRQWHRLFGLTLTDYFTGSPYHVELEKDLSLKRQYLDVLIISKKGREKGNREKLSELPDGLENLRENNLLTYKSHRESLNAFAVNELISHYVNNCKAASGSSHDFPPEESFRLYAVSTRFPEKLSKRVPFKNTLQPGIHDVKWGVFTIRFIVLSRIAKLERNAPWLMFSADAKKVKYAAGCYNWKTPVSTVMNQLFEKYDVEGVFMAYTMEDYLKETREKVLGTLTREDIDRILKGLPPEDRLKGLPPEEIFKRFDTKTIEEYLKKAKETEH